MNSLLRTLSRLHWQLFISFGVAAILTIWLAFYEHTYIDTSALDRSTYMSFVSGLAGILALFCSVSFGFVLFQMQSSKSERLSTYAELKSRLHAFQDWLMSLPKTEDREVCMAMVFELSKLDLSDLPQTDYGDEYQEYAEALELGLDDPEKREFYLSSTIYAGYIEQLLSRIGVISIRQICIKLFIDTLSKGLALIGGMVLLLFVALISFGPDSKIIFISASLFFAIMAALLFIEFSYDMYRHQKEEMDFIDYDES